MTDGFPPLKRAISFNGCYCFVRRWLNKYVLYLFHPPNWRTTFDAHISFYMGGLKFTFQCFCCLISCWMSVRSNWCSRVAWRVTVWHSKGTASKCGFWVCYLYCKAILKKKLWPLTCFDWEEWRFSDVLNWRKDVLHLFGCFCSLGKAKVFLTV